VGIDAFDAKFIVEALGLGGDNKPAEENAATRAGVIEVASHRQEEEERQIQLQW
jgi:hypothetical protein